MKNNVLLVIKGFFVGIANIIPGVSGGTLAITLGIYEELIEAISHFFRKLKSNIKFLIPIGIGAFTAIVIGSRIIEISLEKYTLPTLLFFTGLILGGMPMLFGKIKKNIKPSYALIFLATFALVIGIMFLKTGNDAVLVDLNAWGYFKLFLVGMIAAATMIIPGISGSFMLMVMGYYEPIINAINEFTSFNNLWNNFWILMPFGIGVLLGVIVIAKIIEFLFQKFEVPTYFGIIGFVLASLIGIFTSAGNLVFTPTFIIVGIILMVLGFVIAYKLGDD